MKAASKRRNGPMPSLSKRKKMSMFLARRRRQSESVSVLRSSTWMSTSAMRSPLAGVETEDEAAGEGIEVASAGIVEEDEVVEMVSEGVAMAVIAVLEAEERLPSMSPTKTPFPALEAHSPDRLHHQNCSHRWYPKHDRTLPFDSDLSPFRLFSTQCQSWIEQNNQNSKSVE